MKKIFTLVLVLLFVSSSLFAQEKATLSGKITDAKTSETLPAVNVIIKGTYYGAASDINGNYTIRNVNPGSYTIEVSLIGYKLVQFTGVKIAEGEKKVLNVKLEETVLTLDRDIVVVGEKPMLDVEETQSKKLISREDIEVALIENVKDVVTQQAGVVYSDNAIHIRGGRAYENAFLLDGVSIQDPLSGTGFGLQLSASSIEEVEVITGGYNAEYGQATSGVVNVRTREGGNEYKGSFSWKRDNLGFNKNSFSTFNIDIVEASLSGPEPITSFFLPAIGLNIPGSVSLFGNFYMGISDGITQGYIRNTAKQLNSSTFFGTRFAPRQENSWFWLGKATYKISPLIKLSYSFNQSVNINQNSQSLQTNLEYVEPSPGYQYPFQYNLDNANVYTHNNQYHIISYTHTLNAKTFYEIKLSRYFTKLRADANGLDWKEYKEPKDITTFPIEYYNPSRDTIGVIPGDGFWDHGNPFTWHDHHVEEYSIRGDVTSHFDEKNKFKAGFDFSFREMQLVDIYKPWIGEMGLNNDVYKVFPANGALYVQDNINFSGMILNFGLRLDYWFPGKYVDDAVNDPEVITIPEEIRERYRENTYSFFGRRFKARISPRLGISHPISDNQTLFFSYGHFSKWPKPQFIYAKLSPQSAKSSFQRFGNPDLNPETTVAYELGIRNQFSSDDVFTLTAYYKDIFDYVATRTAYIQSARLGTASFITYINQDYARSRGIEVEYKKRIGRWFTGSVTGAYSIATGKSSSADEGVLVLRGDLDETIKEEFTVWDRPFQASLNLNLFVEPGKALFGFGNGIFDNYNLYIRAFYQSGKRFTPYVFSGKYDLDGRPEYLVDRKNRYGGIGQDWFWMDMNFEKYFSIGGVRLAFTIEVNNLLNMKNSAIINPVTGKAYELGDPTPPGWNDPYYPDYQAPLDPYPFNPARFLTKRNIKFGLSVRF
ncbi:MAG: TonB-dependent receptor [Ignavibacteria bacterium]|nr:TonB-dependent receptor [Ignavibacteria bacterium]